MILSSVHLAARKREDRRPFYRRIFTHRRLDILHKTVIRSIFGFILFSTSYCIVNGGIYYKFVRPLRREERELLERELIEADRAGFAVNLRFVCFTFYTMIFSRVFATLSSKLEGVFLVGFVSGAGFELFKIYFTFNGTFFFVFRSYYYKVTVHG
ncbi:hypothetical protein DICVIV_03736 [Dictyocaulus viviparus]|uniref:Uncharacterized protein n=1 Tax=Dictyocaulus viviparus TaxID=29172 RepID=A0A0D8Y222_DICVI|nr:hypothetical protein DICVIV_03736 [Dictyocaulus viviparus]